MSDPAAPRAVATLWQLFLDQERLSCTVYRSGGRFQLRVESLSSIILAEPFDLEPRVFARSQALRDALKRRGWQES